MLRQRRNQTRQKANEKGKWKRKYEKDLRVFTFRFVFLFISELQPFSNQLEFLLAIRGRSKHFCTVKPER